MTAEVGTWSATGLRGSPSAREIAETLMAMSRDLDDLPESVRRTLEREVFAPVRRIVELLDEGEVFADEIARPGEEDSEPSAGQDTQGDGRILVAGGWETELVERLDGELIEAGLFTSRGPTEKHQGIEYKPYNEDAAVVGEIQRRGRAKTVAFAGVADQAGGMGHLTGGDGKPWIGGASAIAVASLAAAAEEVHQGVDPESALRAAVRAAHEEISTNNPQAGTTIAGALFLGRDAHVITLGDSEVWHFGADGRLKHRCETDSVEDRLVRSSMAALREEMEADGVELSDEERERAEIAAINAGLTVAHILDACIGGTSFADPHYAVWPLERGDYLVFGTDGLGDANLQAQRKAVVMGRPWTTHHSEVTAAKISEIVVRSEDAESATRRLKEYALDQMAVIDTTEYARAVKNYCKAEEALQGFAADAAKFGSTRPTARWKRALAKAQARLCDAGSDLELASGDGKPDNLGIITVKVR